MIALFPPPFDAVDLGSSSTTMCDIDAGIGDTGDSADEEPTIPEGIEGARRLSSYETPAVPTYFHFTINSEARITKALFEDVAVFQDNSILVTNAASW